MKAFQEFERRFAQPSKWNRRLVGADKVLLFLKSVHREEKMDILLESEDGYGGTTSSRIGPKWNGYVGDMMGSVRPQHDLGAAVKRGW